MSRHLSFLFVLAVALASATTALAQTTITLEGVVVNDAGKPIDNAQVSVVGSTTKSVTTNNRGKYSLSNLPPGDYTLTLSNSRSTTITETVTAGEVSLALTSL